MLDLHIYNLREHRRPGGLERASWIAGIAGALIAVLLLLGIGPADKTEPERRCIIVVVAPDPQKTLIIDVQAGADRCRVRLDP